MDSHLCLTSAQCGPRLLAISVRRLNPQRARRGVRSRSRCAVRRALLLSTIVVGLVAGATLRASHYGTACGGSSWHAPQGYLYKIGASTPQSPQPYRTAFSDKAHQWKDVSCVSNSEVFGSDDRHLILQALNVGDTGWLGLHNPVSFGSCIITYATATANRYYLDSYPTQYTYNVACHEHGHAIGLGHYGSPNSDSCMSNGSDPSSHDVDLLATIYPAPMCF
jgi:hypothetical protein